MSVAIIEAYDLAQAWTLPFAVVTPMPAALAAYADRRFQGVLTKPVSPGMIAELIQAIRNHASYRPSAGFAMLTLREREVLHLRLQGLSTGEIATRMGVEIATITRYEHRLRGRLGALLERTA